MHWVVARSISVKRWGSNSLFGVDVIIALTIHSTYKILSPGKRTIRFA